MLKIGIALALLLILSLPKRWSDKMRSQVTQASFRLFDVAAQPRLAAVISHELRGQNQYALFAEPLTQEKRQLQEQMQLQALLTLLDSYNLEKATGQQLAVFDQLIYPLATDLSQLKMKETLQHLYLKNVVAKVICRSPNSWYSQIWIDVGEETNKRLGEKAIGKNSPVVLGLSAIGIVEEVGAKMSRVRLITDNQLQLAVQVARGAPQNSALLPHVEALLDGCALREELATSDELFEQLELFSQELLSSKEGFLLAKGEVRGSGSPLWRSAGFKLKGTGFNLDYADATGQARDLRSGALNSQMSSEASTVAGSQLALPIVKEGDLLITNGLDGIFPKGLHVAAITHIAPLQEGDYYYRLEALPTAGNLNDLSLVMVLPPLQSLPCKKWEKEAN